MNVSCPECQSVFRVDPARVPGPGVRARCSVCGGIIPITAARSWTDDFSTPHDAASLTSARPAARSTSGSSAAVVDRPSMPAAPSRASSLTPPAATPRSATPTRVPPFVPGRRPTPSSGAPVSPPPASAMPQPQPPRPAASAPSSPAMPGMAPVSGSFASQPAAPQPLRPVAQAPVADASPRSVVPSAPRVPEVPIGAPIPRPPAAAAPGSVTTPGSGPRASDLLASAPASVVPPRTSGDPPPAAKGEQTVGATKAPINPFLANDPNQKAKRLARALVSDMVAYHPQKRDEGMRAGTLKQLFREEIKKSYEEYVEQIGKEFTESTSHFQDALNDVLAGGKKVF